METLVIILMIYGFCNILAFSKITEPTRIFLSKNITLLSELISCMMCLSFWCGFFYGTFSGAVDLIFFTNTYLNALAFGFFTSGCVWIIHTIQEFFERMGK